MSLINRMADLESAKQIDSASVNTRGSKFKPSEPRIDLTVLSSDVDPKTGQLKRTLPGVSAGTFQVIGHCTCGAESLCTCPASDTCTCEHARDCRADRVTTLGRSIQRDSKPGKVSDDAIAYVLWCESGMKPHPIFARVEWLTANRGADNLIRPIERLTDSHGRPTVAIQSIKVSVPTTQHTPAPSAGWMRSTTGVWVWVG